MGKTAVDEMQRAVGLYQIELAKLQEKARAAASAKEGNSSAGGDDKKQHQPPPPPDQDGTGSDSDSVRSKSNLSPPSAYLANFAPGLDKQQQQQQGGGGGSPKGLSGLFPPTSNSPLQGMQSITNSLTSQPLHSPYRPPQRSYKAVLPPISQEQFDRYEHINTEDVVRKVRTNVRQFFNFTALFGQYRSIHVLGTMTTVYKAASSCCLLPLLLALL